ncbi:S-adenosyl-L-methionine-dependent methyltransferase [Xylariales sp. PMI_506]|nr:S-adenosyl-L-methionine-dependent methyltransferase [Xylariales sp. PMI_506]
MASQNVGAVPIRESDLNSDNTPSRGFGHIPLPVMPSQIRNSYGTVLAPRPVFSESISAPIQQATAAATLDTPSQTAAETYPQGHDPSFAVTANHLINEILNRTPTGDSVVDPDSIIGESLRLYHGYKDGKYFLPNDAAEQDRLDLQHEMFRLLYDGWLSLVPMSKAPRYVLDIGTGTGLWAFEFAEQNPSSYVIGADLSAIQPTNRNITNCEFVKTDIEDDWIFLQPNPDHQECEEAGSCEHKIYFDYIHLRLMFSCFDDPRKIMKRIYDNLAPGGWVEFQEFLFQLFQATPSFHVDALPRWWDGCLQGARTVGRDLRGVLKYKQWLEEIGFVDVTERRFILPYGEWPSDPKLKLVGRYCLQDTLEGIRGIGFKMLRLAGMTAEEIETLIKQCHTELQDPRNSCYSNSIVIYARKP